MRFALPTPLLLFIVACGTGGGDAAQGPVRRDSAGVAIVENTSPRWADGQAWTVAAASLALAARATRRSRWLVAVGAVGALLVGGASWRLVQAAGPLEIASDLVVGADGQARISCRMKAM